MGDLDSGPVGESGSLGKAKGRRSEDLFDLALDMQRMASARNFALFTVVGTGASGKRKIVSVADNFPAGQPGVAAILSAYGEAMTTHIESSMLPLVWNGTGDNNTAETIDFDHFVSRLTGRLTPFSGVAFPVKLGATGNGYVVFAASYLDMTSEIMMDMHLRAMSLLAAMLQRGHRRDQTSEMLTEREVACLQMAGDGRISEEIAVLLGLSVHTVNAYLGNATTKLDSVNRIQAIAKAIRLGYIH